MSKFTQETRKKFSTIPFYCDNCNNHVMINRYDVLIAGFKSKLHCPICGAGSEHLEVEPINKEHENENN